MGRPKGSKNKPKTDNSEYKLDCGCLVTHTRYVKMCKDDQDEYDEVHNAWADEHKLKIE